MPATPTPTASSVEEATRIKLESAGELSSPSGQAALVLARSLDDPLSQDSGSSKASMAKELRALLADALKDAKPVDDTVDELRAKRERRLSHA